MFWCLARQCVQKRSANGLQRSSNLVPTVFVARAPCSKRASQVAKFFCEQYSIGRTFRSQIEYQEAHFAAVQKLLESNDLPVEPLAKNSKRADVAGFGGLSEKLFSTAPMLTLLQLRLSVIAHSTVIPYSRPEAHTKF